MKKTNEDMLFDAPTFWEEEWQGMPEFKQEDITSSRKIIVHFRNDEDFIKFSELMEQRIGPKQPSIWYPKMENRIASNMQYVQRNE
jgi:hypothetical protein